MFLLTDKKQVLLSSYFISCSDKTAELREQEFEDFAVYL
jgi:hypothetical protein